MINKIISLMVVLIVGDKLASHYGYNISVSNKVPRWLLFINYPYLSIKNRFQKEEKRNE